MELDKEYLEIEEKIANLKETISISGLEDIDQEIVGLQMERKKMLSEFDSILEPLLYRKEEILNNFKAMYAGDKKTTYGILNLSYRVTRSLKVLDPVAIVEVLQKIGKIRENVKSFNLTNLRTLHEAGVLPFNSVTYEEKINITVGKSEQ